MERHFGAVLSAPRLAFSGLIRTTHQAHLPKIRGTYGEGLYHALLRQLDEIVVGLEGGFPTALNIEEQSWLILGYHHQRAADSARAKEAKASSEQRDETTSNEPKTRRKAEIDE